MVTQELLYWGVPLIVVFRLRTFVPDFEPAALESAV